MVQKQPKLQRDVRLLLHLLLHLFIEIGLINVRRPLIEVPQHQVLKLYGRVKTNTVHVQKDLLDRKVHVVDLFQCELRKAVSQVLTEVVLESGNVVLF